jgi:hypothetical protein
MRASRRPAVDFPAPMKPVMATFTKGTIRASARACPPSSSAMA